MLFELAGAAGLDDKRAAMATGKHINQTEDRAVFHIALRSPRDKQFFVDGENVVPAVHSVLDRVTFRTSVNRAVNFRLSIFRFLSSPIE